MKMQSRITAAALCLLTAISGYAGNSSDSTYVVIYNIVDGFTNEAIQGECEIKPTDMSGNSIGDPLIKRSFGYSGPILITKEFMLKISADGYEPKSMKYSFSSLAMKLGPAQYKIQEIELFPQMNTTILDEVTATATIVKMVTKGDTIEYNAAAFQLSEGSMLDNLIKALPGAELHDNGRITVNGEFVSSLMVNGRDFFKGDPRVALSNLPAYTVNKIQVYHKPDELRSRNAPVDLKKEPLVMDVKLKREYAKGLISNYEVGLGSTLYDRADLKWLGRVFAMYYTPAQSIAVYANANNLNDTREATSSGNWRKTDAGSGEITVKSAGLDYTNENKPARLNFNTSLQAEIRNVSLGQQTFAETYLEGGNTFSRSAADNRNNSTGLKWDGKMDKGWDWGWLKVTPEAFYNHNSRKASDLTEKSNDENGFANETPLLYERRIRSNSTEDRWGLSLKSKLAVLSPLKFSTMYLLLSAFGKYDNGKDNGMNLDYLHYPSNPLLNLNEEQRSLMPSHSYSYGLEFTPFSFIFHFGGETGRKNNTRGDISYKFEQQFRSGSRTLDRREAESEGGGSQFTPSAAGIWLPDELNSYKTTRLDRKHELSVNYTLKLSKAQLQVNMPVEFHNRTINDYRCSNHLQLTKNYVTLQPWIGLYDVGDSKINWRLNWHLRNPLPDMLQMLSVTDTSNPLILRLGNPALKKASIHSFEAQIGQEDLPHMQRWSIWAAYEKSDNLIAMAQTYDRQSGLTTLQPRNINGNREATVSIAYRRAIDRNERLYFSNSLVPSFIRSVDYSSDATSDPERLKVNTWRLHNNFNLTWRSGTCSISGNVRLKWNRLVSLSGVFTPFSYLDVNYGLSATAPLPWGIDLDTELMAYCRRGYAETAMNTTDWVWNLTLSKAFGRSKQWVVKATGFDILHQLPNTQRQVNAQGRTETRYNTVNSYALLSLTYRLDIKPKRK